MYDGYSWEASLEDSMDDLFGLDPDKPFSVNLSEDDYADIVERGFDRWLMGLAGIL